MITEEEKNGLLGWLWKRLKSWTEKFVRNLVEKLFSEKRQEVIDEAVEKALLMLPEVVGNMMTQHVVLNKINKQFYSDYPEFKDKKDIVASIVEMTEGKNPLDKYEKILKEAVPKIRERINTLQNMDTSLVSSRPDLKVHGEL